MNSLFIGRKEELNGLKKLTQKNSASLVCVLGRRRIGKSSLIEEFGKEFKKFIEIQGLGPDEGVGLRDQLDHFSEMLAIKLNIKKKYYETWTEAFSDLAANCKHGKTLILLDEISWMARGDSLFTSRLKVSWDTELKKNKNLILVLCGSVSSWISDNLLKNANFEGRISLEINLKELKLPEINQFWKKNNYILSDKEKILLLSITGGVPKYLEELLRTESSENNILRTCFDKKGILFNDYKKIFLDIFGRKSKTLEAIVKACIEKKHTPQTLAKKLKIPLNGDISENLEILELAGFVQRDFYFTPNGKMSRLSHIRVSDNYLRFYLKYIEPIKNKVLKGGKKVYALRDLDNLDSITGLQFENLILANRELLFPCLEINPAHIISAAPFVQKKNLTNKHGYQIDLLIHSNFDTFYLCEIKCKKVIDIGVVKEVKEKMRKIRLPKKSALRPVLIYTGELSANHEDEIYRYFFKVINIREILESNLS